LGRKSASLLPLLPKKGGEGGERRPFFINFPSLRLSPHSFLAGREGKMSSAFFMPNTIGETPAATPLNTYGWGGGQGEGF